VDVPEGQVDKLAPLIENALQREAMKVRVPSQNSPLDWRARTIPVWIGLIAALL